MRMIWIPLIMLLLATGCDFIGGAETLVRGSHNVIADDPSADIVAQALAELESIPEVTDADLTAVYTIIKARALEGDLQAAQVLLRLAAAQRAPEDEEAEED